MTTTAAHLPLPPGFAPADRQHADALFPGGGDAPAEHQSRIPVGPLLSGPIHTVTGDHGQTVHLHRHAYRTTHPDDAAWTAHGYAHRCTRCNTIGGAHDHYTPALTAAETHTCRKEDT